MTPTTDPANDPAQDGGFETFEVHESTVRSYCRRFPAVFTTARNALLRDERGREYIDFLSGAGSLNYGHNDPVIRSRIVAYLMGDGITHSLDLHTSAKRRFLLAFDQIILKPRGHRYRLQFPGPTGTNAVEAAMKLARKVTGRRNIVAFTNAFHGMTLGALAASARLSKRASAGASLSDVIRMPYDGYFGEGVDTLPLIEEMLFRPGSGVERPAAFIVETVQAEGGINVASAQWLRGLADMARRHGVLLIVDDIQTGCGRTGTFFSFERSGIEPDLVCLAKSLSGYGLPMSLVLIRPDIDCWEPGEHNGTFRGNNLAFEAAATALEYWRDASFAAAISSRSALVTDRLASMHAALPGHVRASRGVGLLQGLILRDPAVAASASRAAFADGLIIELCGPNEDVLKILPPLTIEDVVLGRGMSRLAAAVFKALEDHGHLAPTRDAGLDVCGRHVPAPSPAAGAETSFV